MGPARARGNAMTRRTTRATRRKTSRPRPRKPTRSASIPQAAPPPTHVIHQFAGNAVPPSQGGKAINTIVYVHGIGNKPLASVLKCQWDMALFGTALGDRSRMAY